MLYTVLVLCLVVILILALLCVWNLVLKKIRLRRKQGDFKSQGKDYFARKKIEKYFRENVVIRRKLRLMVIKHMKKPLETIKEENEDSSKFTPGQSFLHFNSKTRLNI